MTSEISMSRPVVTDRAASAVAEVLRSGWFGTGPVTATFEESFGRTVGIEHVVATTSGTDALILALEVAGVRGCEVVLPVMTFVATAHAVVRAGATPVFADVDPATGNLDPASAAASIGPRTAAVLAVHHGGLPVDLDELRSTCASAGVRLLEDAAHAVGATYRGEPIGSGGDLLAFSFQATKPFTAGSGGAAAFVDAADARRARLLRGQGVDRDYLARTADGGSSWDYRVTEIGLGCGMTDLVAAIGLAQLDELGSAIARRQAIAARYRERLDGVTGVELLATPADRTSACYLFQVLADRRDALIDALAAKGIETSVHFRPLTTHPRYDGPVPPGAQAFWERCVSLPLHLLLTDDDVDRVCDAIEAGW